MDLVVIHIIIIVILKLRMIVMTAEINNNRWLSSCWMRPGPGLLASELSEPLGWGDFADQFTPYQPGQAYYAHQITTPLLDFQTFLQACCWKN